MATYYVRASMGNDGNTGLSPAQAWLTVDKAANEVAAADTVYIGSGLYRELVTMDTAGTNGNPIKFIGDIDGKETGDGGPVIISAHDSPVADAARAVCLLNTSREFIEWSYVIFDGGTTVAVDMYNGVSADLAWEGCVFDNCVMLGSDEEYGFAADFNEGATPSTAGLILRSCVIDRMYWEIDNNLSAHVNAKASVENCILFSASGLDNTCHLNTQAGAKTYGIGGILFVNNIFSSVNICFSGNMLKNTTDTVDFYNNIFYMSDGDGIYLENSSANTAPYDYNIFFGIAGTAIVGTGWIDGGNNEKETCANPLMIGGWADLMFYNKLGWSPWKPWEPIVLQDGVSYTVPQYGFATATQAPATDVYGNPRPMGRNTDDAGPVEARTRPQADVGTVYDGTYSAKFAGAGFYEYRLPVAAAATTVTVWARYDGNYTGSLPILEALNITGDTDQSDVMVAAVNTWEQLSVTFTPTVAGFCTIRLRSQDTSATGECFFDLRETA